MERYKELMEGAGRRKLPRASMAPPDEAGFEGNQDLFMATASHSSRDLPFSIVPGERYQAKKLHRCGCYLRNESVMALL